MFDSNYLSISNAMVPTLLNNELKYPEQNMNNVV